MGDPLHLCFVASASIHSRRWIGFFAERGHRVSWFVTSFDGHAPPDGLPHQPLATTRSGAKVWKAATAAWHLRREIAKLRPDVVHAHYAGVPGVLGAASNWRPFVLTAWGSDVLVAGRRSVRGFPVRWALRKADLVTCDAEHMISTMTGMGIEPRRCHRINFGTDVDRFRPLQRDPSIDQRLQLAPGPRVISIRNLQPVYDVGTLIRAAPLVLRHVPDATFIIGGSGPEELALRQLATTLGVESQVRFCGSIRNEDLPAVYAAADVYVSTALSDAGLSASTQEAMACSLPVAITRTADNDEWIENGRTGFLFAPRDSEELARQLIELLSNPTRRQVMAREGRGLIARRSNHQIEMEKMEALYYALADRDIPPQAAAAS